MVVPDKIPFNFLRTVQEEIHPAILSVTLADNRPGVIVARMIPSVFEMTRIAGDMECGGFKIEIIGETPVGSDRFTPARRMPAKGNALTQ
jgi:hypothetical protein